MPASYLWRLLFFEFIEATMGVERKYERDIDVLLAEEFSVSPAFADWFKGHTKFRELPARVVDVFVSKFDDTGESDLVALFEAEDASRFALHIEDKINACLQPSQSERYHARATGEIAKGLYGEYAVLLCAPEAYCKGVAHDTLFDAVVPYESVATALLDAGDSARSRYRAEFVATAAKRPTNAWVSVHDPATKAFWDAEQAVAESEFPILEMKPYDVTKNETWRVLRPANMPTRPKLVQVHLKGQHGNVDLSFGKTYFPVFVNLAAPLLEEGMTAAAAGASSVVRLKAPKFTIPEGVETGLPKIREAFAAADEADSVLSAKQARSGQDCRGIGAPDRAGEQPPQKRHLDSYPRPFTPPPPSSPAFSSRRGPPLRSCIAEPC